MMKQHKLSFSFQRKFLKSKKQRGIALLFTLSILSISLITALLFSSQAISERKVAANFADTASAKVLADGTVHRAIAALMNSEKLNFVCSNYRISNTDGKTVVQTSGSERYWGVCDFIWHLEKKDLFTFDNGPLRYSRSKYYDYDDVRCPSWEYVLLKDNDNTPHLYGRYAYVAIAHNDQLNANALGNHRTHGSGSNCDERCLRRLGRWTCEPSFIFKKTLDRSSWDETSNVSNEKIQTAFQRRGFSDGEGWGDADTFFHDVTGRASGTNTQDRTLKLMLEQYFSFSTDGDYNKFSPSGNIVDASRAPGSGEQYRYPLIRSDWDSVSVDAIMGGIPFFANSTLDQNQRRQIIANLINYNARETRPAVTDVEDWFNGEPSYTGNKRTPYINEVASRNFITGGLGELKYKENIIVDGENSRIVYDVWYENCSYKDTLSFKVELVNMYPSSGDYPITGVNAPLLKGTLSFEYYDGNAKSWLSKEINFDRNEGLTVSPSSDLRYPSYNYIVEIPIEGLRTHTESNLPSQYGNEHLFYGDLKIRNIKVALDRIILQNGNGNADLSLMPDELKNKVSNDEVVVGDNSEFTIHFDAQTNDPRYNLARNQWQVLSVSEGNWDGNIGTRNSTVSMSGEIDPESVQDPAYVSDSENGHVSTAFIRHANMESLWELGAVHRAAPWQTINLKRAKQNDKNPVIGAYRDGDGHLLDQVTMTEQDNEKTTQIGYINLNTSADFGENTSPFVFKALFTDFPRTTNGNYAALDKYPQSQQNIRIIEGESIDSTNSDADKMARQLSEAVGLVIEKNWPTRRTSVLPYDDSSAELFNEIIPTDKKNDAYQEEVFSRIVNLLQWSKQKTTGATILVIAQTLRDVGGGVSVPYEPPTSASEVGASSLSNYLKTISGHRSFSEKDLLSTTAYRSAKGNFKVQFGQYDLGFDEILGESKEIVRLKWDAKANNGKGSWKTVRKEYVN